MQSSNRWHLNTEDVKTVLYTLASTLGSTIFYEVIVLLQKIPWNQSSTLGVVMLNALPFLIILAKQWVSGPPCQFTPQAIATIEQIVTTPPPPVTSPSPVIPPPPAV